MIKTISLTANEEKEIEISGGCHCCIENRGSDVIYASKAAEIVADNDGVTAIDGGSAKVLRNVAQYKKSDNSEYDYSGTIYILSNSDGKAEIQTANDLNFFNSRNKSKGGGSSSCDDTVIKSDIASLKSNVSELQNNDTEMKSDIENLQKNKVEKDENKVLSDNNYTDEEKNKLSVLENYDDTSIKNDIALNLSSIGMSKKNFCPINLKSLNENGWIIGTATPYKVFIPKGKYILTWKQSAAGQTEMKFFFDVTSSSSYIRQLGYANTSDANLSYTITLNKNCYAINFYNSSGACDFTEIMIRHADIIDSTYEPYQDDLQTQINNLITRITALEGSS